MARSANDRGKYRAHSLEGKPIHTPEDNDELNLTGTTRPKGRIRRQITACNTCRKLKTRCDLEPRSHACRRCLSLRLDCQLPDLPERSQDNPSLLRPDGLDSVPCMEERLASLERSMGEMTRMMREMMDRPPSLAWSSASHTDEASSEGSPLPHSAPQPAHLIQELQSEFFGEAHVSNVPLVGDLVTAGIIDSNLSWKLIQLFVEHFGSWISITDPSAIHNDMAQTEPLLFNTACLLASRYVPGIPLQTIYAMYLQVRNDVVNMLWKTPPLSFGALQALTLLCLWSAKVQKEISMDSWLLSGMSINHAIISLKSLSHASADQVMDDDMLKELRIWNALCLTQLHSAIGNARPFNLQQKYLDQCSRILEHPNATYEDRKVLAEIQLYLVSLRLQHNTQQMLFADSEYEDLERWRMDWAPLFIGDQSLALELSYLFCQLLLHRTAMLQSESVRLTSEIHEKSRLIVSNFLQASFSTALGLVDQVYFIVGYAALTLCDFNMMDPLVDQIQSFLMHLSPNEDHIACRFSCIISEFKRRCSDHADVLTRSVKHELGDHLGMSMEHATPAFIPTPQMDTSMVGGYGSLESFVPDMLPAQPMSGAVLPNVPLDAGMASGMMHPS